MVDEAKARDITVAHPFTFLYKSGVTKRFEPGLHKDVGDEVADHPFAQFHILKDGERMPASVVDASDPVATQRRIAALEEERTRLQAEVQQGKDHVARVETDLAEARTKAEAHDALVVERDDLKARNASLEADVERLTKPPAASPTSAKPTPAAAAK